jgi:S-adenosylmethionine:tRNA ribosyltransferase-isomerase
MRASDFDYDLPPDRIAQRPLERRDGSRMMVLDRAGEGVTHRVFADLPELLCRGDLLVVNDTRVVPARFFCLRATGGRVEGLFLREQALGRWEVLLKGARRCREGEALSIQGGGKATMTLSERREQGRWVVDVAPPVEAETLLRQAGLTPLPPYIRRDSDVLKASEPADRQRYQTVYADQAGAVAAPTAGLHFTPELLDRLEARGIERARVTLHVGPGTFAPVKADAVVDHEMHAEWYRLTGEQAERINRARADGGRVVAVGTTSVRVLESAARADGSVRPSEGWTDIFIYPPRAFHVVDALITNFHLPRSTLVMLVSAFADPGGLGGVQRVLDAYRLAVDLGYRFYSYGDAMLIR